MEVHGHLDMRGNKLKQVSLTEEDFPANPTVGRFVFKNQILYVCVDVSGGFPVWVPLTQSLSMKRFVQSAPSSEWVIVHGLSTNNVFVQVYDENGRWVVPDETNTNTFNTTTLTFNTPITGTAILMRGNMDGNAYPVIAYEQSFSAVSTWVINHNLGYNPTIALYIDNQLVQPQSLVHNSLNQSTATFSAAQTGSARCI